MYDLNIILLPIYGLFVSNLAFLIDLQYRDIYVFTVSTGSYMVWVCILKSFLERQKLDA